LDNLGKFKEKGDEGYFIGYLMSSKAFRLFNKRIRRVEENLHVEFLENKAIEKGAAPNWLFDIDSLTKSMNYMPVDAGTFKFWGVLRILMISLRLIPLATIAISCNPVQHSRTKHIDVRYHFIKEKVEKGIVELFFVGTEYQLADLFTKALPVERFQYLVRRLGMRCLTPAELEALANESA
nr:ribonuclease H-like domain-containing protein [Tanacetum cinerariifolium]